MNLLNLLNLLKLFFLIIVTIFLSLLIQLPTYLGVTQFNENIIFKIMIGVVAFIFVFSILLLIREKCFPDIPVNKSAPWRITLSLTVLTLLLAIGTKSLLKILGHDMTSANNDDIMQQLCSHNIWFMVVSLHSIGPILEEIVFRGIFLESLIRLFPNKKFITLFLSSFIFAYAHTYKLSLNLLDYFISGLLYGVLYYKSRNLRDSVLAHVLTNVLITVLLLITGVLK